MNEFQNIKSEINIEKTIKSLYIIKDIFSFLSKKLKLNIVIYNKQLQKKLDINAKDYKRESEIYREGKRNGKGKEFDKLDNKILFEGEYLNGKRNGKGKEYYKENGKLKFEGKYLNGKRNEKGKEYYYNGQLKFEGEYLYGKRWNGKGYNKEGKINLEIKEGIGNGKEYFYKSGNLEFEGEYLNGEKNGKGKEYYKENGKLKFEGEYLNGKRNGKGKEYYYDGKLKFEGHYLNGKRWNGKGFNHIQIFTLNEFFYFII